MTNDMGKQPLAAIAEEPGGDSAKEGSQAEGGDEAGAPNGVDHGAQSTGAVHSPRPPAGPSASKRRGRPPPPKDMPLTTQSHASGSKPGTPMSKPPHSPSTPGSASGRLSGKAPGTSRLAEVLGTPGRLDLSALGVENVGELSSSRKRSRKRKLFADEVVGLGEAAGRRARSDHEQADDDDRPPYNSYEDRWPGPAVVISALTDYLLWDGTPTEHMNDDVGEGVDALLSLASLAHASSSGAADSPPYGGADGGVSDRYEGGGEASGGGRRASSRGTATPRRPINDGIIYRTGTPGAAPEFLVASPLDYGTTKAATPRGRSARTRGRSARGRSNRNAATARAAREASLEASDAALALQQLQSVSEGGDSLARRGVSGQEGGRSGQVAGSKRAAAEKDGGVTPSSHRNVRSRFAGTRTRAGRRPARYEDSSESEGTKPPQQEQQQQQEEEEDQEEEEQQQPMQEESEEEPSPPRVGRRSSRRARQRTATARAAPASDAEQRSPPPRHQARRNRRKSAPEALAPQLAPLRALFSMTGTVPSLPDVGGLMAAQQNGVNAAALAALQLAPLGETNEPMTAAERVLRHTLGPRTRRWAAAEWHYSALDRPYFLRSEMQDLLDVLGLSHVTQLTRPEWSVLRSSFGRPRRLSLAFLREERLRLEVYRERVRKVYDEVGVGMEVPAELPRPLKVGQAVVARHPVTRHLHDGIILTIKSNQYRVQFNRSELMTEVVMDVDVMPVEPAENLPIALPQRGLVLNGRPTMQMSKKRSMGPSRSAALQALQQQHQRASMAALGVLNAGAAGTPVIVDEATREADTKLLAELAGVLNRKENLLAQLRDMNVTADVMRQQQDQGTAASRDFQAQYAAVLASLSAINTELSTLLVRLEGRPHLGLAAGGAAAAAGVALRAGAANESGALFAGGAGAPQASELVSGAFVEAGGIVRKFRALADKARALRQAGTTAVGSKGGPAPDTDGAPTAAESDAAVVAAKREGSTEQPAQHPVMGLELQQHGQQALEQRKEQHAQSLDEVITGCICMLLTVQKCTGPGSLPAGGPVGIGQALDLALAALRPRSADNEATFKEVADSVAVLKAQLARAC